MSAPSQEGPKESSVKDSQPSITTRPRLGSQSSRPNSDLASNSFSPAQPSGDGVKNLQRNSELAQQKRREIIEAEDKDLDDKLSDAKFAGLDITNEEIDFGELKELMASFNEEVDPAMLEALSKGVDPREYGKQIEEALASVERDSVADYLKEMDSFGSLHEQIKACDGILESMETLLRGFQSDLGTISEEIRVLQDKSGSLNVKLQNRKELSEQLSTFVNSIVVTKSLIENICEGEVNESYLQYLVALNKAITFAESQPEEVVAKRDVAPELEKLRVKAVTRIREFLLEKIYSLKRPKTNVQIIQQSVLLKHKYLIRFLGKYALDTGIELRDAYITTMSAIYQTTTRTYISNLMKLQNEGTTKTDLLGVDENASKSDFLGGLWSSRPVARGKANIFALGDRQQWLAEERPMIIAHEAAEKGIRYPYEALFNSMHRLLIESASAEYVFDQEFFGKMDLFGSIFEKTAQQYIDNVSEYLANSYDSIAIFVCYQVACKHQRVMLDRRVKVLQQYFEKVKELLWARLKVVFELNIDSLKKLNPKQLGTLDTRPHYITRRFAEFLTALHAIDDPDKKLQPVISQLRTNMEAVIGKMATETGKLRVVFLINNYNLIVSTLSEREKDNRVKSDSLQQFSASQSQAMQTFIDELLLRHFGKLVAFVRILDANPAVIENPDKEALEALIKDFAVTWRESVAAVHKDVNITSQYFPNFKVAQEILSKAFAQLAAQWAKVEELVKKHYRVSVKDFVPSNMLLPELRKYTTEF